MWLRYKHFSAPERPPGPRPFKPPVPIPPDVMASSICHAGSRVPWGTVTVQRRMRVTVRIAPSNAPYWTNAATPYSLQLGLYRHRVPSLGDRKRWYARIAATPSRAGKVTRSSRAGVANHTVPVSNWTSWLPAAVLLQLMSGSQVGPSQLGLSQVVLEPQSSTEPHTSSTRSSQASEALEEHESTHDVSQLKSEPGSSGPTSGGAVSGG